MPRHLIGDAHEWINEIPTVPTHSLAKLQPSQRSWDLVLVSLCVTIRWITQSRFLSFTYTLHMIRYSASLQTRLSYIICSQSIRCVKSTQLLTYVQQRGKKTLLSLTLICYCHLVGMAKIVRGSTFICTTMKHRYLTIWLTYCISIASALHS